MQTERVTEIEIPFPTLRGNRHLLSFDRRERRGRHEKGLERRQESKRE